MSTDSLRQVRVTIVTRYPIFILVECHPIPISDIPVYQYAIPNCDPANNYIVSRAVVDSVATIAIFWLSTTQLCCVDRNPCFKSSWKYRTPCRDSRDCRNSGGSTVDREVSVATTALIVSFKATPMQVGVKFSIYPMESDKKMESDFSLKHHLFHFSKEFKSSSGIPNYLQNFPQQLEKLYLFWEWAPLWGNLPQTGTFHTQY